jgi:outer membrane protein assembly factor BamB
MEKSILRISAVFFCCLLALPSISCQMNSANKVKSELNVDLIYPYPHVSLDNITITGDLQLNKEMNVSSFVADFSSHQWPQQGLNCQHVGRSPYSTAENPGIEKWRFAATHRCDTSPVIDVDGTIYFGSNDQRLYAIYPNGTLKWKFRTNDFFGDYGEQPGIAANGTIFAAGTYVSRLYAIHPNGTEWWHCETPRIRTSITISDDGMLYYGHLHGLDARYPNGTLKWTFNCGGVQSTPAVDSTDIIYFGGIDSSTIYALYPNGTVKWSYPTGAWVHGSPTIAPDGTIYCGSDDYYLYAFYPNGTLRWKTYTGSGMRSSPSLDEEGNLYFGMWHSKIMSITPDGAIRWTFPLPDGDRVWGSTAAISDDCTIYIGSSINMDMNGGGEIIALDLDGTLKWRKTLCDSTLRASPVISADGSVYICSSNDGTPEAWGYLHAFNTMENNQPPETPIINGPAEGNIRKSIKYTFKANDTDHTPISFYIDWGDETHQQTIDNEPGIIISVYHTWTKKGTYTIRVKAIDTFGLESDWATLAVTMPLSYELPHFQFYKWLFERFPNAFPILRYLFEI